MKRIILKCQKNCQDIDRESAICFHGWLMQYVSPSFANQTHRTGNNPFSLYTLMDDIEISFVLNLLTESAEKEIMPVVLDDHCKSLALSRTDQGVFKIVSKTVLQLTQEELSHRFYSEGIERFHKIQLLTPTAFKTHGHYYFLPDIRLIFQSLMKKYNSVFEGTEHIDLDLLKEICNHTRIEDYCIRTRRYNIHKASLKGFLGRINLYCNGNMTLTSYVDMLLHFAEYSGIGVKTSLGMGAVKLEERRGYGK